MPHRLKQRIDKLRARVRVVLALYGLGCTLAVVLGAVLMLGLLDYLVRFQDPGIRLICSLVVVGVFAWSVYSRLWQAMSLPLGDVELAQKVQRRFPQLDSSLASAVEFLDQGEDDPTAGSAALRQAVIAEADAKAELLDFGDALQRRPARRAGLAALAIMVAAMIVGLLDPRSTRVAVARLINPFGSTSWPQRTHLALRERVERVARGQAFEIEVADRFGARLPDQVRIHYRFRDAEGTARQETERMRLLGPVAVARRDNVSRPFAYRVEGGDDQSMPWIAVEVVEPPAVESLVVELTPPPYTGWPKETTTGHVRALVGTRMKVTGRATKALRQAVLCLEDGRQVAGRIEPDGRRFTIPDPRHAPLVLEASGAYWLKLTDTEGLHGGQEGRWEIRAVPDTPPSVSIEQPDGMVFVTSDAVVPLRIAAKDDLALQRLELRFTRPGKDAEEALALYAGPPRVPPREVSLTGSGESGENRRIEHAWSLASLGLVPGTQLSFRAVATDYKPQTGTSEPRRLAVITREELADRIASRQAVILAELARTLEMQRQNRQQVADLDIRLSELGRFDLPDIDRLRGVELNQRQIHRTLTSRSEGVPLHILGLLADLANNKVDSPDVERRMGSLLAEIDRLSRDHLPAISQQLTSAIKTAQSQLQQPADASGKPRRHVAVAASLASAGKHQDAVIASLEQMLGQLARWDNYRRFYRDLTQLARHQEELSRRTLELGRRTLTKELKDLLPQELAELKAAAAGQFELARQWDRLLQEMRQTADTLQSTDPLAAETLRDAVARAGELTIGATMRSAGEGIEQNRIGDGIGQQKQIQEQLQEMLDILAQRRQSEWQRLVQKLAEAAQDLAGVIEREEHLRQQMERSAQRADDQRRVELAALARQQDAVREQTQQIAKHLDDLASRGAAETVRRADQHMDRAAAAARNDASRLAALHAEQAREALEQAAAQLADERRQAEAERAVKQLAELRDALQKAIRRQQNVLEETRRLDQSRSAGTNLTRLQAAGLADLAREQRSLQTETRTLAEALGAAEVFHTTLAAAAEDMGRAAAALERRQTDAAAQQAEQDALSRLGQLDAALTPEPPDADPDGSSGGQGGKGQLPSGEAIRDYAQLKLLRILQDDLNRRTRELDDRAAASPASEDVRRQAAELSQQQRRLAEMLLKLARPEESPQEKDPR